VAFGSAQRFGVPLGYGGPHAAFFAVRDEHRRLLPGRLVGVSKDAEGRAAYRLSLQTREQHIRRDKATSNICTAQVLLAILASMYAVYHGPEGLRRIARRVHGMTQILAEGLARLGWRVDPGPFFDTLRVRLGKDAAARVLAAAQRRKLGLRDFGDGSIGIALDEAVTPTDLENLIGCFALDTALDLSFEELSAPWAESDYDAPHARTGEFLTHEVFRAHRSEHEMLRYLTRLAAKDVSLAQSMIPLGSCTMKLNGTSSMLPVTWPEFARMHPFAPREQALGYEKLTRQLERWLAEITGFAAVSLQPNSGAQGEYAGLLVIRAYHEDRGQADRDVCLIPTSAHGTNPASAVLAGLKVVAVACDAQGNVDLADLEAKATQHAARLAALVFFQPG